MGTIVYKSFVYRQIYIFSNLYVIMKIIRVRAMFSISMLFVIIIIILSMLPFVIGGNSDREDLIVEANVFAPVVKIEVPNYVFLGNVTKGFSSDRVRIDINNTGTTAVSVTPELEDSNENIFKYLTFARRTTEQFVK